jgi:WXG100 family type VII secretion target
MATASSNSGGAGQDIHVKPHEVIKSVKGIDDVNDEIKRTFAKLKAEGEAVITGSWTGSAADKLNEGWQEWQQGIAKVTRALDQANRLVEAAAGRFQRADEGG